MKGECFLYLARRKFRNIADENNNRHDKRGLFPWMGKTWHGGAYYSRQIDEKRGQTGLKPA